MKLKVFRIAIGFHDAYVAASTKKAAIEAWGSGKDVFTRGEAEIVTDAKLTKAPLSAPGKVVKVLRGTAAEQIAALGRDDEKPKPHAPKPAKAKPARKPRPRPTRTKLDKAEAALAAVGARFAQAFDTLAEREAALARERASLQRKHDAETGRLEARRAAAETAFDDAMESWRRDA